ncbi:Bug family tripartite tricarboxylate transporter substrate binding protein [Falsiroseomonas oryziterrae]|uniref:Bug family tripartite tricarboxylate transporter substrate binding protein n=1 Tax=Falsiroseomonas oryziterrae TaxID=2911368 RepID=UPI001F458D22|nr:tripartite tricarboxylate transporter substrate binding protein [Roseomonas sp. NPKOSM-4]
MHRRDLLIGAALAPALAAPAFAQAFPSRPIRIVVPFAPGGAVDITGRLLAERLQPILNQQFVVENRGGAGGNLGADVVAKAEKDGHTILLGTATILAANKFLFRGGMPFDPIRDMAPVTRVSTGTVLLVVNSQRPWRSFAELIEFARRNPGRVTMGSSGTGTVSHLTISAVSRAAGVDITHVPYRGGGPAITDLVAGQIDMMFDVMPALMPHVREGRFRALAVGSADRVDYVPGLEQVPGMRELMPQAGIDMQSWYAVAAPSGTAADRIATLHRAILQVVRTDDFRNRLQPLGFKPIWDETPEAFGQYWRSEEQVWQRIVEASGATMD